MTVADTSPTPDALAFDTALDEPIGARAKGFACKERFSTMRQLRDARPSLFHEGFTTPIGTLLAEPLERNMQRMSRFCAESGVEIAPHAKTTLAPQLFGKQIAHGAWGVTVATPWQARLCAEFDVPRILLANELVDIEAAEWMTCDTRRRHVPVISYVDSPHQVERMSDALADRGAIRPLDVLLEVGWNGGRTGCRNQQAVTATAHAVAVSPNHRLVGVAGFEGLIGSDASASTLAKVRAFLRRVRTFAEQLARDGAFKGLDTVILTAGGSGFFDLVVQELIGPLSGGEPVTVLLRSGCYLSGDAPPHDKVSPLTRDPELSTRFGPLEPAIEIWTRVLSRPEPGLAILDAGKRDMPLDVAMPVPSNVRQGTRQVDAPASWRVNGANDQHCYLSLSEADVLEPGDFVSFSVVHPCTFFDKWTWIPMVDPDYRVVDVIRTYF